MPPTTKTNLNGARRPTKPEKKIMLAMGLAVPLDVLLEDAGTMG
jgi:hypothetical protein